MMDQEKPTNSEVDVRESLLGTQPSLDTAQMRQLALDQALDYRGDVTLHTLDGRMIEGYVFDHRRDEHQSCVRLIAAADGKRVDIPDAEISKLIFSGRDTAAGKSWETWVKKYQEKKEAGEPANLESDLLE